MRSIYAYDNCGLANRLVIAINLFAVCTKENLEFRADAVPESVHLFRAPNFLPPNPNSLWRPVGKIIRGACRRSSGLRELLRRGGILSAGTGEAIIERPPALCVGGWHFSWDTVKELESSVRSAFALEESFASRLKLSANEYVGLHARRGDYQSWQNGAHYYEWDQYERFARELLEMSRGAKLLLSSNETPPAGWLDGVEFEYAPSDPLSALYTLSQCKLITGPPSTFSLYAAWTGGRNLYTIWNGQISEPRFADTELLSNFKLM